MSFLDDLLKDFPDLEPQKNEIEKIITAMEQSEPSPALDDAFVQQLRTHLMKTEKHTFYSFFSFMQQKTFVLAGSALALLLMLPAGYSLWKFIGEHGDGLSTGSSAITMLDAQAFGDLSHAAALGVADGKGGGGMNSGSSVVAPLAADEKMMAPPNELMPYEPTVYIYSFAQDLAPYLTDATGTVYERQAFSSLEGSILTNIAKAFSHLNINAFLEGDLTSFVLRAHGYMLSVDSTSNMWNMYKDWTSVSVNDAWTPLQASDLPSDEAIIATAKDFATTWGIDITGYGEPVIAEPEIALARAGTKDMYIPESATVVFPILVEGQYVYPSWTSAPTGLRIGVSLRDMQVTNAYDALSQSYNASSYNLTQDPTLVGRLIAGGGSSPAPYTGISVDEVIVPLNAPERVLMEYSLYENGQSRTLFIPALRFTMTDPSQIPWTNGVITIPLVKDIAEAQDQVNTSVVVQDGMLTPLVK